MSIMVDGELVVNNILSNGQRETVNGSIVAHYEDPRLRAV